MLEGIWSTLLDPPDTAVTRDEGAAFLAAAGRIYGLTAVSYFCMNIQRGTSGSYAHYALTEHSAARAITARPIATSRLAGIRLFQQSGLLGSEMIETGRASVPDRFADEEPDCGPSTLIKLPCHGIEFAIFAYGALEVGGVAGDGQREELRILGNYFHGHILRRNGADMGEALMISARELDCLRWAAAGKSAWEASVILGISQRTVRFHLNSAREKLNCSNTTQAVAKAVSKRLIAI